MPESLTTRPPALALAPAPSEPLDKTYSCAKCSYILKDPVQTQCGHRYCRRCWQNIFSCDYENGMRCQAVNEDEKCEAILRLEEIHTDKACASDIQKLCVNCPSIGCDWNGFHVQYEMDHMENCLLESPFLDRRCRAESIRPTIHQINNTDVCDVIINRQHEVTTEIPGSEIMACIKCDISKLRMVLDQPIQSNVVRILTKKLKNIKMELNDLEVQTLPILHT